MARTRTQAPRFDARGGVNSTFSEDVLDATEVRRAYNARLTTYGALVSRNGSRRLHSLALPGAIRGLYQWDAPAGKQLVAVAAGNLYHKLEAAAEFTEVPAAFSTTRGIRFAAHRIGAAIVLYLADGLALRKWDGTTLSTVAGAPAATDVAVYKGRLYATDGTKRLYASAVGAPDTWAPAAGGFFGDVETYDTEGVVGIRVVGDSLVIAKEDNVARLTGVDPQEIRLDTETSGVSGEVGLRATGTLVLLEGAVFGLSDRGAWIASESALDLTISQKVEAEFLAANRETLHQAIAAHHRRRKEVWLAFPEAGASENSVVWVYAYDARAWSGPWTDLAPAALARYELADGTESIVSGGYDGYVREEDVVGSALRDVLADGTGGTPIGQTIDYGALTFGDPGRLKSFVGKQSLQADLGASGTAQVAWESEYGQGLVEIASLGAGVRSYPYKLFGKGRRLRLVVRTWGPAPTAFLGFVPVVSIGPAGGDAAAVVGTAATGVGYARADGTYEGAGAVLGAGVLAP